MRHAASVKQEQVGQTVQARDTGIPPIDDIIDNFALLDEWDDRYRYVIELGRGMDPLPDIHRCEANKVPGCASQVWLGTSAGFDDHQPVLHFCGDSDAHIVRGLVAILLAVVSGKPADQILAADPIALFERLGLREHLTPQRSNGFRSMVTRIRADAEQALANRAVSAR
jgi:cysteine desulfuration protein SufE